MELKKFSPAAQTLLRIAKKMAREQQNQFIEPEHVALALLGSPELLEFLEKKNLDFNMLESSLKELIAKLPQAKKPASNFSSRTIQLLSLSHAHSLSKSHEKIFIGDIFISLLENRSKYGALGSLVGQYFLKEKQDRISKINSNKYENYLAEYCDNLHTLILNKKLDPVFGRLKECQQIIEILLRKNRNNPVLIGESGVGKTSLVYLLARKIINQEVPSYLVGKELIILRMGSLISGTSLRGQLEERINNLLEALVQTQKKYILIIPDLGNLAGVNSQGSSEAVSLLKPKLARGDIQILGIISPESYTKYLEKDHSFARYFQPLWVSEPEHSDLQEILSGVTKYLENFHGVFVEPDSIQTSADLARKHISKRKLPEVAINILDQACAQKRIKLDRQPIIIQDNKNKLITEQKKSNKNLAKIKKIQNTQNILEKNYEHELNIIETMRALQSEIIFQQKEESQETTQGDIEKAITRKQTKINELMQEFATQKKLLAKIKKKDRLVDPWVRSDDIAVVVSQETGIPAQKMLQSEREKLRSMPDILSSQVIGQNEGIEALCNAITRARVGIKNTDKPIGSFLFLGPTGVGKTELARKLTGFLFDDEKACIRFDMSEFMERHSVARLIGAPPGYQGFDEGGQLTESVRRKPYAVLLLDEIEKAHQDVLNILLQVLDEGRLSDSQGRLVKFNNCVIIMTSNLGAEIMLAPNAPKKLENTRELVLQEVLSHLRPELLNRIDEVIFFNSLTQNNILKIANIILEKLKIKLAQIGVELIISPNVAEFVAQEGFSPHFGARPLERTIKKLIEDPLAQKLLTQKIKKVKIIYENKKIILT